MAVIRLAQTRPLLELKLPLRSCNTLHQRTSCPTAETHCLQRHPLEGPGDKGLGEVETGPLTRFMEPGWLTPKICTPNMQQTFRRKKEIVSISGFDNANGALVVDTLWCSKKSTFRLSITSMALVQQVNEHKWRCHSLSLWFSQYYSFFYSVRNLKDRESG